VDGDYRHNEDSDRKHKGNHPPPSAAAAPTTDFSGPADLLSLNPSASGAAPPTPSAGIPPAGNRSPDVPETQTDTVEPPAIPDYEILGLLGRGGMGTVYRARHTRLGREVAIKVPQGWVLQSATAQARFLREARAAATLAHRNICPILDLRVVAGIPCILMPLIQGTSLARRLADAARLGVPAAVALVRKLALAVEEAHRHGIIHRDLKPANIMIDEQGEPVVMDFGLAHCAEPGEPLTRTGDVLGTPAYMAPEQFAGRPSQLSSAADVYSLGVILYQLLTGAPPFQGNFQMLACQARAAEPPPPSRNRPGLDARLDAVCLRCLAKNPSDRWPSMAALAEVLADCLEPIPEPGRPRLMLRVQGTPFAYQPPTLQDVITLGRQKRRPGGRDGAGNDLVLRVPNDAELSARISRRHLEIRRTAEGFVVIDRSQAGTWHNGQPLVRDVPALLADGDRLVVAGFLSLEVVLRPPPGTGPAGSELPLAVRGGGRAILQVSAGDLVTVE
jgi:serine/threonine-protein kinase